MALAYSNLVSSGNLGLSTSAVANAKKKGLGTGLSVAPLTINGKGKTTGGQVGSSKPAATSSAPTQPIVQTPTYTSSTSKTPANQTYLLSSLQDQLKQKQSELAKAQEAELSEKKLQEKQTKSEKKGTDLSLGGLVGSLVDTSKNNKAVTQANKALVDFRKDAANYKSGIFSAPTSARVMQGRDQAVQLANAQTESALASQITNSLEAQRLQQDALGTAVSAAAPVQVPYGTQYLNPLSGESAQPGMGTGGGALNPLNAIPSYAQQVKSGAMSYDQAVSALGNNPAFVSALNQSLGSGFSPVQSNANASVLGSTLQQTSQQSNQLQLASGNAYKALSLLSDSYNNLGAAQKGPIPLLNKAATFGSQQSGIGAGATQAYTTAIQEARAAVSQVLSAVGNTPTYSEATAAAIIPDNAGPEQIASAIRTVEQLIQQKVQSFSAPGIAPQYGGQSSMGGNNIFAEDWGN